MQERSGATCHMTMPLCCYLAKGAKRRSHTTNTIKFDHIPFDPCNSTKRFDLCPFEKFDLFTATLKFSIVLRLLPRSMQFLPFAGLSEISSGLPKWTSSGTLYFTEKDLIKQQLSFTDKSYLISLSQQLGCIQSPKNFFR